MKKLIASAALLALAACATEGTYDQDETLTQAPYAEERTVGPDQGMTPVRSAEPVFQKRQVK